MGVIKYLYIHICTWWCIVDSVSSVMWNHVKEDFKRKFNCSFWSIILCELFLCMTHSHKSNKYLRLIYSKLIRLVFSIRPNKKKIVFRVTFWKFSGSVGRKKNFFTKKILSDLKALSSKAYIRKRMQLHSTLNKGLLLFRKGSLRARAKRRIDNCPSVCPTSHAYRVEGSELSTWIWFGRVL